MGREWYWGGRSSKRAAGGLGEIDTSSSSSSSSGCMGAVFQFFDFHHLQFPLHQQQPSFLPEEPTLPKGVEAPRNSLESEEVSLSSVTREEENLNIPKGIQIKTSKAGATNDSSSEISSSPGTKTPTLVARLMGLDLLPENHSPSSSSSSRTHGGAGTTYPLSKSRSHSLHRPRQPLQTRPRNSLDSSDFMGSRSLPETPRISSARRSDVDHHHRLSLQINKENVGVSEDLEFSRFSYLRRKELRIEDENSKSPRHYARQIVKQVKEKVSRKVGIDITNTITNRDQRRDELLLLNQFKSNKVSKACVKVAEESSPRLRFLESKHKPNTTPPPIKVSVKPKTQPLQEKQLQSQKCRKAATEKFRPRLKKPPQTSDIIRNKQEEPFVRPSTTTRTNITDKKCKRTPLSNELLNNITVPTLLPPAKKDPSPPATKIPQKQVSDAQESKRSSQLSSCLSQTYKQQEATQKLVVRESNNDDISNGVSTTGASGAEYQYITNILSRTGIENDTNVSFTNWFSPSHPLDPSIFHQLEYFNPCPTFTATTETMFSHPLSHECNRKLLFHLLDEILVEILKPHINMKPWVVNSIRHDRMQGSHLINMLCSKIRSFPCANCSVLEDIDALIDKDLPKSKLQSGLMAFEEEGEGIVMEIEKEILDTLVHETALEFW